MQLISPLRGGHLQWLKKYKISMKGIPPLRGGHLQWLKEKKAKTKKKKKKLKNF